MSYRLKTLSLRNFLTYEKESLQFADSGLAVFIGGNGTGKTSLFNALRFVLGSNQKDQRYRSWSDFINNRGGARLGWVEATFEGDGGCIRLRREVRRGEAPRFYIDGRRVSAEEFREVVHARLGIDPDNPLVFVPQGRVDAVKDMEPVKLREFVEELVGLTEERRSIDEREAELRDAIAEAERLREDLRTIQERTASLAPKVERLRRRKEVEERLRRLEGEMLWSRIEEGRARLKELAEAEAEAAATVNRAYSDFKEASERVEAIEREVRKAKEEVALIDDGVRRLREEEAELKAKLKEILEGKEKALEEIERGEGEVKAIGRKIEDLRGRVQAFEEEIEKLEGERGAIEERIEGLLKLLERISSEKERFKEWERERVSARAEVERAREKVEALERERGRIKAELRKLGEKISACSRRVAELAEIIEGYDEDELRARMERVRGEKEELIGKKADVERKLEDWEREVSLLEKKVSSVGARIPEQVRALEEDVKRRGMNVEGPLLRLIEVRDEYAEAVEAVFGRELLSFVAFDEPDFYLLNELRRRHDAWCTIYLLRKPEGSASEKVEGGEGGDRLEGDVQRLEDVISFPREIGGVVREVARRTFLVKDYKSALALSGTHRGLRFVTLKGEVVEDRGGTLRSPYRKPRGLLAVKKVMEELEEARRIRDSLRREHEDLEDRLMKVREEEKKVERALMLLPEWRRLLQEKMSLEEEEKRLREEEKKVEDESARFVEELERARSKLAMVESSKPSDYVRLEEEERRARAELEELKRSLKKVEEKLRRRTKEREEELLSLKELEGARESISRSVNSLKEMVVKGTREAEEITRRIDELEEKIRRLTDERRRIEALIERKLQELGEGRERVRVLEARLGDKKGELEKIVSEIQAVKGKLEELEEEAGRRGLERPVKVRPLSEVEGEVAFLEEELAGLIDVDEEVTREAEELEERRAYVAGKLGELEEELRGILEELERMKGEYMARLVGAVEDAERIVNELLRSVNMRCRLIVTGGYGDAGVEVRLSVKGGPMVDVTAASGGERCFFAIALMVALQRESRVPLVVLDEPSTHLDSENSDRTGRILKEASAGRQVLVFVPDKYLEFAKYADQCYGTATSGAGGASIVVPVRITW